MNRSASSTTSTLSSVPAGQAVLSPASSTEPASATSPADETALAIKGDSGVKEKQRRSRKGVPTLEEIRERVAQKGAVSTTPTSTSPIKEVPTVTKSSDAMEKEEKGKGVDPVPLPAVKGVLGEREHELGHSW